MKIMTIAMTEPAQNSGNLPMVSLSLPASGPATTAHRPVNR